MMIAFGIILLTFGFALVFAGLFFCDDHDSIWAFSGAAVSIVVGLLMFFLSPSDPECMTRPGDRVQWIEKHIAKVTIYYAYVSTDDPQLFCKVEGRNLYYGGIGYRVVNPQTGYLVRP